MASLHASQSGVPLTLPHSPDHSAQTFLFMNVYSSSNLLSEALIQLRFLCFFAGEMCTWLKIIS